MIDAGWVAAIASVASAFVVVFATVASFQQIKHFRNANDIAVYLRLVQELDRDESLATMRKLPAVRARVLADAAFRENLKRADFFDEDSKDVGLMLRFLEHVCTLVVTGGVAERLLLAEYSDNFEYYWSQLRELVYLRREAFGPHTGAAFEHIAMRAQHYRESGAQARLYGALKRDPRGGALAP